MDEFYAFYHFIVSVVETLCYVLSARFFDAGRALNFYFMIMIMIVGFISSQSLAFTLQHLCKCFTVSFFRYSCCWWQWLLRI